MRFNIVILASAFISISIHRPLYGQEPDTDIEQFIESQAELNEENHDFPEVGETLTALKRNPLNLNTATREQLKELLFLTPQHVEALLSHRNSNGFFLDLLELQGLDGFNSETMERILPYVTVQQADQLLQAPVRDLLDKGEHDLMIRFGEVLEEQRGFQAPDTTGAASRYLGNSSRLFARYRYRFQNKLSIGLSMEKDAGEAFFRNPQKYGFDFYSGFIAFQRSSGLKRVVVGDYSLQFGEGLTMWSGLGFGKGAAMTTIAKNQTGLRPYSSTNESRYLRGLAATVEIDRLQFTPFVSYRYLDGNLNAGGSAFTSVNGSGFHRTETELANKGTVDQLVYGLSASFSNKNLKVGSVVYRTQFDKPFEGGDTGYKQFDLSASGLTNAGVFYTYNWKNLYLFGEAAHALEGGSAYVAGLLASLTRRVSFATSYRNYDKDYHCFFNSALAESSSAVNEKGFYTGLIISPNSKTEIAVYADVFSFPWLKYRVDAPSNGSEVLVQLSYSPNKTLKFSLRYKSENKEENTDADETFAIKETVNRQNYRAELSYKISRSFQLRNRVEIVSYQKGEEKGEEGYLLYQDVIFNPLQSRFSANARFAIFDTDGFDSRIYAYERDVLYSYSLPGFQNRGTRFYLNGRYKVKRGIDLWLRYALTQYTNVDQIGSGLDLIEGSHKSDIRAQVRIQF